MWGGRVGLPEQRLERGDGVSRGSPEQSWTEAPGWGALEEEQERPQEGNAHGDKGPRALRPLGNLTWTCKKGQQAEV